MASTGTGDYSSLTADAQYADWMETALYNGILPGISLDGLTYFYQNPLADRGLHRRVPWFRTPCCPPNVARLFLSLSGYFYSTSAEGLWAHFFATGRLKTQLPGGEPVAIQTETGYPWDGQVRFNIGASPETPWSFFVRIPAWAAGAHSPRLFVNGQPTDADVVPGTYAEVRRVWRMGDVVELDLPMDTRRIVAHPHVQSAAGRVALTRGPLVYCAEGVDHPDVDVSDIEIPANTTFRPEQSPDLLSGIVTLTADVIAAEPTAWGAQLYRTSDQVSALQRRATRLRAVPYYAWANRAAGPMQIWLRDGSQSRPTSHGVTKTDRSCERCLAASQDRSR